MIAELKSQVVEPLAVFAFPAICQICGKQRAEPADGFVCVSCRRNVFPIRPPWCDLCGQSLDGEVSGTDRCQNCQGVDWDFDSARSLFAARGLVREVIYRFKYEDAEFFEPLLNQWLYASSQLLERPPDWVVPVPLHALKQRERGFNQAFQLARGVAGVLGVPLNDRVIRRVKDTGTQTRLSRAQRLANMRDAFEPCREGRISGRVLLVDDVMTTGATASACADALKDAGAEGVVVLTLARGLPV